MTVSTPRAISDSSRQWEGYVQLKHWLGVVHDVHLVVRLRDGRVAVARGGVVSAQLAVRRRHHLRTFNITTLHHFVESSIQNVLLLTVLSTTPARIPIKATDFENSEVSLCSVFSRTLRIVFTHCIIYSTNLQIIAKFLQTDSICLNCHRSLKVCLEIARNGTLK